MIVRWERDKKGNIVKEGVLVFPCGPKKLFIVPGHNEVPDEEWAVAKQGKAVQRKLERGQLKEYVKEVETTAKTNIASKESVDLLTVENFPYNEVISILKEEGMLMAISEQKFKETGKKRPTKEWLIDYFKEVSEDWDVVKTALVGEDPGEPDAELFAHSVKITELETNEAEAVIQDTWNMETLEKWKTEVSQPDLRVLILNQIEEVNKPPRGNGK